MDCLCASESGDAACLAQASLLASQGDSQRFSGRLLLGLFPLHVLESVQHTPYQLERHHSPPLKQNLSDAFPDSA